MGTAPSNLKRAATVARTTKETQITVTVNLDGGGASKFVTGIPFLEHMLEQVARHGLIDLDIAARGDLHIDAHHTVEDIGITFGQAFAKAAGDKQGITRYGHAYVPLDEALSRVVVDLSGRPGLEYRVEFPRARIGEFDVDLLHNSSRVSPTTHWSLHIDGLRARTYHISDRVQGVGRAAHGAGARCARGR